MIELLKNFLFQNKRVSNNYCRYLFLCVILTLNLRANSQVANYISNGSFEELYDCNGLLLSKCKSWLGIDSTYNSGGFMSNCNNYVPLNGSTYQLPRTDSTYILSTWYNSSGGTSRSYLKNRLKANLQTGKTYCAKFHVNIANTSPRGMDGFGIYFGDNTIDTIKYYNIPLVYITPQVQNPHGNIILDTLKWISITGSFVANGTEKYALLGNFLADNAIATASIGGPFYPQYWTDVCIDDVSCIELNLPAFAGRDTSFFSGDSLFLGRTPDVGINEACIWYKLPSTIPIDTIAGFWIKPTSTSTYVVRQEICGLLKWDTVVVFMNLVGLEKLKILNEELKIYPIPAKDQIEISFNNTDLIKEFNSLIIYNNLGLLIRKEEVIYDNKSLQIKISDLPNGVYSLQLRNTSNESINRRFLISR